MKYEFSIILESVTPYTKYCNDFRTEKKSTNNYVSLKYKFSVLRISCETTTTVVVYFKILQIKGVFSMLSILGKHIWLNMEVTVKGLPKNLEMMHFEN